MTKATRFRNTERGEGQAQSLIMLAVFILLAICAKNAGPVFWDNYQLTDSITEIAGKFPPNADGDKRALQAVARAIRDNGMTQFLDESMCSVTSGGGIGGTRTVSCTYTRDYQLLPGMKRTKTFEITVSRPMF